MKRFLDNFKTLLMFLTCLIAFSCMKHEIPMDEGITDEQVQKNLKDVFGTTFSPSQDWKSTTSGTLKIKGIPAKVEKIQLIAYIAVDDSTSDASVLNEVWPEGKSEVDVVYDIPTDNKGLYVAFFSGNTCSIVKALTDVVSYTESANTRAVTRAITTSFTLPSVDLSLFRSIDSYASTRGWIPGEKLWQMEDYIAQKMDVADYDQAYKDIFRMIIFTHFKNGRKYNNLPLVKESGFYNESAYPFTTGEDPIIISPVYKNDGGYKEVVNSDLYYYYFKDEDLVGKDVASYLKSLPKYKAIQFDQCIKGDDEICKHAAYALIYWGDGTPSEGTTGSYYFPAGYKIGFMVRAMTTAESGKKQGELYSDGRLNNDINNYSACNFKSSKLGTDGPRGAWITVNGRTMLCLESGTDSDFNDIILEVEGGIDPPIYVPDIEYNSYTFCFEDTPVGDYDMNDVVIRAKRINETKVEYEVVACGAYDELFIMNINGQVINSGVEVHRMFNKGPETYINTLTGQSFTMVKDQVTVSSNFSFLDESTQPYIYDKTTDVTTKISRKGESPHGIMIPYSFRWPLEKVCVKDAYTQFNNWGQNPVTSTEWYKYPEESLVF